MRVLVCLMIHLGVFSQEWMQINVPAVQQIMHNVAETYRVNNYEMTYSRKFYLNYFDTIPLNSETGSFFNGVKGNYVMTNSTGITMIQNNFYKMVADTSSREVNIIPKDTVFNAIDISGFNQRKDWNNYTYSTRSIGDSLQLRMQRNNQYEQFDTWLITFFPKSFAIYELDLLLAPGNYSMDNFEDQTQEIPRMIMYYSKPVQTDAPSEKMENWVELYNNELRLHASKQAFFKLIDLRVHRINN